MSDLVERIRQMVKGRLEGFHDPGICAELTGAADEIEKLRNERDGYKAGFDLKSAEVARLTEQLVSVKKALSLGAFEARQLVKKSTGPRDRKVALSFESFCKTQQAALSDDY